MGKKLGHFRWKTKERFQARKKVSQAEFNEEG
jgi:hypothetical protein